MPYMRTYPLTIPVWDPGSNFQSELLEPGSIGFSYGNSSTNLAGSAVPIKYQIRIPCLTETGFLNSHRPKPNPKHMITSCFTRVARWHLARLTSTVRQIERTLHIWQSAHMTSFALVPQSVLMVTEVL